jgi:type I restriction enzyme S subunit
MYGSVGKTAFAGCKLSCNQAILGINPKEEGIVNMPYLKLWFDSNKERLLSGARGVALKNISATIVRNLKIPLPPLPTQTRIARALDLADRHRRLLREELDAYDRLGESLFLEMFGDPVRNEMGWDLSVLSKSTDIISGHAFRSKHYTNDENDLKLCGGVNIDPSNINWSRTNYWPRGNTSGLDKYFILPDDIIVAMDRPWISTGFKSYKYTSKDDPALLVQRTARIRTNKKSTAEFILYSINSAAFQRHCNITETTVPHLSIKDFNSFQIPTPALPLQTEFAKRIKKINELKAKTQTTLKEADDLFNALLQRAFRGELFVE